MRRIPWIPGPIVRGLDADDQVAVAFCQRRGDAGLQLAHVLFGSALDHAAAGDVEKSEDARLGPIDAVVPASTVVVTPEAGRCASATMLST